MVNACWTGSPRPGIRGVRYIWYALFAMAQANRTGSLDAVLTIPVSAQAYVSYTLRVLADDARIGWQPRLLASPRQARRRNKRRTGRSAAYRRAHPLPIMLGFGTGRVGRCADDQVDCLIGEDLTRIAANDADRRK
jgi:hypothetical protein